MYLRYEILDLNELKLQVKLKLVGSELHDKLNYISFKAQDLFAYIP